MSGERRWRFAFSKRWLGYLGLLIVFAIACGFLSHWQFERRDERVSENARITGNFDREPVPLESELPALDDFSIDQEWTPVLLQGRYLTDEQLLARSRPHNGLPGFEILTPFETDDGRVFIVNRGWIPTGDAQDSPDHIPAAPEGEATIVARLKPGEPEIPGRTAPAGQIATIHLPQFADELGTDRVYTGAYGLLSAERPNAETGALTTKPALSEGNHLSYAFQWIIFAIIALLGLIFGLRAEYRDRNPDDPKVREAISRERERAGRRRKTDAEIEDEILDRAGG
ncbi:SURF1 family protein [Pseudoclavibacter sp. RFBJ3]|uniref:SURF1 family cytochrome oxidase biogenesis protein n=1 Tax=unclassified Pseudoclavibacter TaxID=2615177 RepID=UPI000CE8280A|nr:MULTISPECIES: SURF1 family protein [unclassified Pseudoclavibacter]PPF84389.1 SURF1 family protein [Pseudoclavibacter sp. RFBJ5]PPF92711.1 SURF1 family protein [Pseudoclavibacter sp. RFBJ3]PPF98217.1 SURF1 family protein [Pseudoclavibacter sp. RFBH5]PPG25287.1 SURF1 family protein [Pseudoclavibacter sp. RFBI4]